MSPEMEILITGGRILRKVEIPPVKRLRTFTSCTWLSYAFDRPRTVLSKAVTDGPSSGRQQEIGLSPISNCNVALRYFYHPTQHLEAGGMWRRCDRTER